MECQAETTLASDPEIQQKSLTIFAAVVADAFLLTQVTHTMQWAVAFVAVAPPNRLLQKVLVLVVVQQIVLETLVQNVVNGTQTHIANGVSTQ